MFRIAMAAAAAAAALLPDPAYAQASGQITLFTRTHSKGARTVITGPRQYIEPARVVRSIVLIPGTQWELCSGSKFSGCRQFSRSVPSMVMTVRSVRPVSAIIPAAGASSTGGSSRGRSLRGATSEYFVTPEVGGNRVEVQPGTAEEMSRRAGEFCRARGWRSSNYERLQSVAGRFYLADVLCVDVES